ncbi:hypothetical protein [Hymenobacter tenuis]
MKYLRFVLALSVLLIIVLLIIDHNKEQIAYDKRAARDFAHIGHVKPGMSARQVLAIMGPPAAMDTLQPCQDCKAFDPESMSPRFQYYYTAISGSSGDCRVVFDSTYHVSKVVATR